ncbi:alpha/beta hydrolase family protein [Aeromicrobium sp. CF4.19]|uniref:alpha/beta hydrolase family protein n=1 Tax=Aeromicrobium sp. CF4.19 TaxID=3373082 RepID=UPI003EE6FEB0
MHRRDLLRLGAVVAAAPWLASCGGDDRGSAATMDRVQTVRYGEDPSQLAELTLPEATPRGVVVVIHGGFWRAQYDLSLGRPLAESLAAQGWAAWNLEYRRLGNGGGWPETFDDVAAGIDALADVDGLDTGTVVTLGHSAGGHLAVWAAGRDRTDRWSDVGVPVTAAVSQAGVIDLGAAEREGLGGGAVAELLGPDAVLADADPRAQVPLDVPVRCVHGTDDQLVPISQSRRYVDAATQSGADAELVEVDGDHFVLIDPSSDAWRRTLAVLDEL